MNETAYGVIISAVIIGLVQALKTAGLKSKYCPIASIALGFILGILFLAEGDIKKGAILGLVCGLSACGLYDTGKKISQ